MKPVRNIILSFPNPKPFSKLFKFLLKKCYESLSLFDLKRKKKSGYDSRTRPWLISSKDYCAIH